MLSSKIEPRIMTLIICVTLVLAGVSFYSTPMFHRKNKSIVKESLPILSYDSHAPITIANNLDFEDQSFPGEGTSENPYRISGVNITSTTAVCIRISNTSKYFTISGCWFRAEDGEWGVGVITLESVVHAQIEENIFESGHIAISVEDSSSCNVVRNEIGTSLMGFLAYNLNNSEFSGNRQISEEMSYPVHIQDSNNVIIRGNSFQNSLYEGIGLSFSTNCYVEFNTLSGGDLHFGQYGIATRNSQYCHIRENNVSRCGTAIDVTDGRFHFISNNYIGQCWGGVMIRGNETIVTNNEIKTTGFCIQLRGAFYNSIHLNYLESSDVAMGIDVNGGGFSNITENIFYRHEFGIRLQGTENLTISQNSFTNCFLAVTFEEVAYVGLQDGYSVHCRIVDNILEDCGLSFSITDPVGLDHEIVGNLVNGKRLAYFYDIANREITGEEYGRIILVACNDMSIIGGELDELTIMYSSDCEVTGVSVANQTDGIYVSNSNHIIIGFSEVSGNEVGVRIEQSSFCHLVSSIAFNNGHGILVDSSPNSTIYDCELNENEYGMVLIGSHSSHIESNLVYKNTQGIYLLRTTQSYLGNNEILENQGTGLLLNRGSRSNKIVANSFGWNSVNALCSGFDNVWDDGSMMGNRWSDLGKAYVYRIDEDDVDRYPTLLGNGTVIITCVVTSSNETNSTTVSGEVTPEIAVTTGVSLLGMCALALLIGRKRGT